MSRSGSKRTGTTRQDIRRRRARGGWQARLIDGLRRFGIAFGVLVFVGWLGAWVVLTGAAERTYLAALNKAYDASADAGFAVDNILVEGRYYSDPDVLRAILNIERGDPIFAFNPAEARAMIERISWVREAHVERRLPDTVYIGLIERTPIALWQNKGKIRVIDADGVTLTDTLRAPFRDLPLIVGENAPEHAAPLLRTLAAEPTIHERLEAATFVGERRWDLKLKNGITVKLPEKDIGFALRRLATAQDDDALMDRDLTIIDLRESDRITVRTRPGAVEDYQAAINANAGSAI